jgi:hypothetical protein
MTRQAIKNTSIFFIGSLPGSEFYDELGMIDDWTRLCAMVRKAGMEFAELQKERSGNRNSLTERAFIMTDKLQSRQQEIEALRGILSPQGEEDQGYRPGT